TACKPVGRDRPGGEVSACFARGHLTTRTIAPNGLAGGRGDLVIEGARWSYLDKPPATLTGPWSRVENVIVDRDHIRFAEFESGDEGKTWVQTNDGTEERVESE